MPWPTRGQQAAHRHVVAANVVAPERHRYAVQCGAADHHEATLNDIHAHAHCDWGTGVAQRRLHAPGQQIVAVPGRRRVQPRGHRVPRPKVFAVADHLSAATTHAPRDFADQVVKNFVVGVEMTQKELQSAFERNGLKRIEPEKGGKFDPHQHQAMMEQPGEGVAPGAVIKTLQAGYELHGRMVRPAMVVVAAKTGAADAGATPAGNPYADADGDTAGGSVDTKA